MAESENSYKQEQARFQGTVETGLLNIKENQVTTRKHISELYEKYDKLKIDVAILKAVMLIYTAFIIFIIKKMITN